MKIEFDLNEPPSAADPLPGNGSAHRMRLLRRRFGRTASRPSPEERREIEAVEARLSASLIPATPVEIRDALGALLHHYPTRPLSDEAAASVLRDWIADLSQFPADIIFAACQSWRRRPHDYAPTPGHLIEIAEPILKVREFHLTVARRELQGDEQPLQRQAAG